MVKLENHLLRLQRNDRKDFESFREMRRKLLTTPEDLIQFDYVASYVRKQIRYNHALIRKDFRKKKIIDNQLIYSNSLRIVNFGLDYVRYNPLTFI